jgi:hypothetical protein
VNDLAREARGFARLGRLHPGAGENRDWRRGEHQRPSGEHPGVVSLRNKAIGRHQSVHQDGGGRLGGEREHGAHRGCRIWPGMPADVRSANGELLWSGAVSGREGKGR